MKVNKLCHPTQLLNPSLLRVTLGWTPRTICLQKCISHLIRIVVTMLQGITGLESLPLVILGISFLWSSACISYSIVVLVALVKRGL